MKAIKVGQAAVDIKQEMMALIASDSLYQASAHGSDHLSDFVGEGALDQATIESGVARPRRAVKVFLISMEEAGTSPGIERRRKS